LTKPIVGLEAYKIYLKHLEGKIPFLVQLSPHKYEGVLGEIMTLETAAMERWRKGDPWGFIGISLEAGSNINVGEDCI
jgi:hypothetical protein